MALGSLLLSVAGKAYDAYKNAAEKKKPTTTVTPTKTNTTPTVADHQAYINKTNPGGMDAYTKLQQERLNGAYATGDQDLINRLNQDAQTRGYSLSAPQIQQQPQPIVNPYNEKEILKMYASLNNQIEDKNQAAVRQGMNRLQSQIPGLNQGYDNAARQAYIMSMQSKKALPQQLAMQGATGGATETAMLGLDTSYQNNLSNINTQRQNSINDINNAIVDLQNTGDLNSAEQVLGNNQAALSAYQNMLNNSASFNQWLANFNANRSDAQWEQNYQTGRDAINDNRYNNEYADVQKQQEYKNILNRLNMGLITPNDAVALGVPAQDVQAYVDRIIAAQNADLANTISLTNNRNSSGTGTGGGDESTMITQVVEVANGYLKKGDREKAIQVLSAYIGPEQIKKHFESLGVRTDDIDWGITEPVSSSLSYRQPTNPALSIENIAAFLKSQGLSNEEIAQRLSR